MRNIGRPATGLREPDCQVGPDCCWCRITASARSRNSLAETLKSAVCGSSTVKYKSGRRNFRTLFDSMMVLAAFSRRWRKVGIASARRPCSVLTQKTRLAPACKKREVSESPERSCSSVIAQEWSPVAQSQASPLAEQIPWPYCVIFAAVHSNSGKAVIKPATTLVLPTLRECPPTTMRATANPFLKAAPGSQVASDTGEAAAPEFPKTRRLCRAESCWARYLPVRRPLLPLRCGRARRCLLAHRAQLHFRS